MAGKRGVVLAAGLAFATHAWAWGSAGHQVVGAIADRLIAGTPAQQAVQALLPHGETLQDAAVWADCAKGGCGALTPQMREFVQAHPQHRTYHYTDLPFQAKAYVPGAVGTAERDVVQTLQRCIAVLRGDTTAGMEQPGAGALSRQQALRLAVHLVGDLHQPLHVGTAYLDAQGRYVVPQAAAEVDGVHVFATQGGNALRLGGDASLHGYWDHQAVELALAAAPIAGPDDMAQWLLAHRGTFQPDTGDPVAWPLRWADETLGVSRDIHRGVVPGPRRPARDDAGRTRDDWPVTLPVGYDAQAADTAQTQLWRAGQRLGALLQTLWPAAPAPGPWKRARPAG